MIVFPIIYYLLLNFIGIIALNETTTTNQLNVDIDYGENSTIILLYNLTTQYNYFITFRPFGDEQIKLGLFSPTNKSVQNSIDILYHYDTRELFIICFYFILSLKDLDIQCKDLRLVQNTEIESHSEKDFLPSYNPLFVPLMYALSVLMLLPVIIQHHRRKQAKLIARRKQIRSLSISIAKDDPSLTQSVLSKIVENGKVCYENLPIDIRLLSMSPTVTTRLDDLDDPTKPTFTLETSQPYVYENENYDVDDDDDDELIVDAHDCVAHLLDSAPWSTSDIDEPVTASSSDCLVVRDSARAIKEQYVPTIILSDYDNNNKRKFIHESN